MAPALVDCRSSAWATSRGCTGISGLRPSRQGLGCAGSDRGGARWSHLCHADTRQAAVRCGALRVSTMVARVAGSIPPPHPGSRVTRAFEVNNLGANRRVENLPDGRGAKWACSLNGDNALVKGSERKDYAPLSRHRRVLADDRRAPLKLQCHSRLLRIS